MATAVPNRPKGRSIRNLRMVWAFASNYPGRIACAAMALLVAAAAATSIPYGLKLIIDKGFGQGAGNPHHIAKWFEGLLGVVVVMAVATACR
jgi:ATP-binding cassette, subfamily B, bacterial